MTKTKLLHESFAVENGAFTIGGIPAEKLAEKYGTPLYVIDTDAVRRMCREYSSAISDFFGENSHTAYAGKAFCCRGIYSIINEEGMYADCVSVGEIYTALSAGFPRKKIFFHGSAKTDAELEYAVREKIGFIVVDSEEELDALDMIAGELSSKQRVLLRITPGIDAHTHKKIATGGADSKFGSSIATGAAERITRLALSRRSIALVGFHAHIGSQIFDSAPFLEEARIMLSFIADMRGKLGYEAAVLDLGGGFGVRYTESDPVLDIRETIRETADEVHTLCARLGLRVPDIFMEPGRSIVASAGATLYTAQSVKSIEAGGAVKHYAAVDGGMTDDPRYALYQSAYTVLNASRPESAPDFICSIAGRCCESGDILAEGVKIARPERGDVIAFLVTGAYNYSMASNYNRVPRPPVIAVSGGKDSIMVRRETPEDLLKLDT